MEKRKCPGRNCKSYMEDYCSINLEALVDCPYVRGDDIDEKRFVK